MPSQKIIITDEVGFHARTASVFSKAAAQCESDICVEYGERKVNGKSMLAIMTLGAKTASEVNIIAEGADEAEALRALIELIESNFAC